MPRRKTRTRTVYRTRRAAPRRRKAGLQWKPLARKIAMGLGIASIVGGTMGTVAAYAIAGPVPAAGAYFAPQIRQQLGQLVGMAESGGQTLSGYLY
jgi:hypothetical protein